MRRTPVLVLVPLLAIGSFVGLVGPASAAPSATPTTVAAPTSSKAEPYVDEGFVLSGDIGNGIRTVTLERKTSSWKSDQTAMTCRLAMMTAAIQLSLVSE